MITDDQRDDLAKLVYDTWVKTVDGPHWLEFKDLPYVSAGDYDGCFAVADALAPKLAAAHIAGLREAAEIAQAARPSGPNPIGPLHAAGIFWACDLIEDLLKTRISALENPANSPHNIPTEK